MQTDCETSIQLSYMSRKVYPRSPKTNSTHCPCLLHHHWKPRKTKKALFLHHIQIPFPCMFKAYRKKKSFLCRLLRSNSVLFVFNLLCFLYTIKKTWRKNFNVNNWSSLPNGYRNTLVLIKIQYIFCSKACSPKHNLLSMSFSANFMHDTQKIAHM